MHMECQHITTVKAALKTSYLLFGTNCIFFFLSVKVVVLFTP